MFPIDLDGLFPTIVGDKTERQVSVNKRHLDVAILCRDADTFDLTVVDRDTNKTCLRVTALPKDVIQFNWKLFREAGFQRTS